MDSVAIIPARGGSKRIPRKNIRKFRGVPIIGWSIRVALESGLFRRVIVSTDDCEIADIAREYGAEVPFKRPSDISEDLSSTSLVMSHAAEWLDMNGDLPDTLCCIYATAPLLTANDLRRGFQILDNGNWTYVISAAEFNSSVYRGFKIARDGEIEMLFPEHRMARSQDLPSVYHDAGQFYWGRSHAWISCAAGLGTTSTAVVLPRWRVQDIDDENDWKYAEILADTIIRNPQFDR